MLGDGRKMCFRSGVIDTIVSGTLSSFFSSALFVTRTKKFAVDWPWGLRENSYAQIQKVKVHIITAYIYNTTNTHFVPVALS